MRKILAFIALAFIALVSDAIAQTVPPFDPGSAPTKDTWNSYFAGKADLVKPSSSLAPEDAYGLYNCNPTTLAHWRAKVAAVRAGTGRGTLVTLGDSTSMGAGAGSGGTTNVNGAYPFSWPSQLSKLLNGFVGTNDNAVMGDQGASVGAGVAYGTYDTRVTLGAGWGESVAGNGTFGAALFTMGSGNFAFAPGVSFDTLTVYYATNGGLGSFSVNVDGGSSLGTVSTAAAASYGSTTFTVAAGSHTVNVVPVSGIVYLAGISVKLSTSPAIDVLHDGWWGSVAANFTIVGYYQPLGALEAIAPDVTVIEETINDSNNGTNLAAYTASMQALISGAQLSGDVILMVGPPSNTAAATNGTLESFIAALLTLAATNGACLIDTKQRWTSFAVASPLFPYYDGLHTGKQGYQDMAQAVYEVLSRP